MITVQIMYDKGVRLETPMMKFGSLKRYHDKTKQFSKPYLMIRDEDTGQSLLPPLYNYDDIFMKDNGLTVVYRGIERIKEEDRIREFLQEWEIEYCSDTTITDQINKHISGVERVHRENDEML